MPTKNMTDLVCSNLEAIVDLSLILQDSMETGHLDSTIYGSAIGLVSRLAEEAKEDLRKVTVTHEAAAE